MPGNLKGKETQDNHEYKVNAAKKHKPDTRLSNGIVPPVTIASVHPTAAGISCPSACHPHPWESWESRMVQG